MIYMIRPSYKMTGEELATRLCDILVGRSHSPNQPFSDKPTSWDVTGLNNCWLHATPEPDVWELSCRLSLKPELIGFLSKEFGLNCSDQLTWVVLHFDHHGQTCLKKLMKQTKAVTHSEPGGQAIHLMHHGYECERRGGAVILREEDGSEARWRLGG